MMSAAAGTSPPSHTAFTLSGSTGSRRERMYMTVARATRMAKTTTRKTNQRRGTKHDWCRLQRQHRHCCCCCRWW